MKESVTSAVVHDDLARGREAAVSAPSEDVMVAWVAFGDAPLQGRYRRVGQVQFFGDEVSLQDVRYGADALARPEFERAAELTDEAIEWHFSRIEAQHYVLARVEFAGSRAQLPLAGTGPPIAWASRLAAGVVEAAGFRLGGTGWILLDGGCYFLLDGSHAGSAGFGDPVRRRGLENFRAPIYEPTGEALAGLQPAFADALARGEAPAVRAVTEVAWHRRATAVEDAAMRLALRVRGFETQWAAGPGRAWTSWEDPVRYFFRDHWAREGISSALFSAASTVQLPPRPLSLRFAFYPEGIEQARAEIFRSETTASFTWKPGTVLRLAPTVATYFTAGSLPRRQWKELARYGRTGGSAQAWWRQLRTGFDVLLNRAVRQRNAVVHGRELVPDVVASVEPFLERLSSYLVAESIDAASGADDLNERFKAARNRLADDYDALATADTGLALYPEE
jgi:hypothetical protein